MRQDDIDLDIADVARPGAGGDQGAARDRASGAARNLMRGTSASRVVATCIRKQAPGRDVTDIAFAPLAPAEMRTVAFRIASLSAGGCHREAAFRPGRTESRAVASRLSIECGGGREDLLRPELAERRMGDARQFGGTAAQIGDGPGNRSGSLPASRSRPPAIDIVGVLPEKLPGRDPDETDVAALDRSRRSSADTATRNDIAAAS